MQLSTVPRGGVATDYLFGRHRVSHQTRWEYYLAAGRVRPSQVAA